MIHNVDAIYDHGVFRPVQLVTLPEGTPVHLRVEPANGQSPQAWLHRVQSMQAVIVERQGVFPDSAPEISADRTR